MSFNMKDNQRIKKSNGHNCCNILSKQKPMSLQQCSENGWVRKILYRKMPAAQHRSDERITTSPFCNSSVIADSRRGQRKHKTWLKSCWEIALWQKSPHKFSLTAKEKYPCTRERDLAVISSASVVLRQRDIMRHEIHSVTYDVVGAKTFAIVWMCVSPQNSQVEILPQGIRY